MKLSARNQLKGKITEIQEGAVNAIVKINVGNGNILTADITIPTTNNRIEGGVNAQLRSMLRAHRGLSLERRLKAVYWWCYMHSPRPLSISDILNCMPTDESIAAIYKRLSDYCQIDRSIPQWGDAPVWNELHMSTDFPTYWD